MKILNTPLTIRNLTLKNRILLPPMAVVKGDMESRVTDELVAYYDEKAASGIFGIYAFDAVSDQLRLFHLGKGHDPASGGFKISPHEA